ncbi:hypothetical protein B0T24DRAFT_520994 [Lasiosphaeria ovina]|uniref:LysM domain-containing protein n=1 Tax=Lasiosphaeria ovina TaxID=92902 RepID=A0AAE0NE95_9PEZI|nr:hypothetical protein B0T24DRAFT_520994 [Lasiosphaeria ovina]
MIPSIRAPDSDSASTVRPRNRRLVNTRGDGGSSSAVSSPGQSPTRTATPIPAAHIGSVTGRNNYGSETARASSRGKSPAAAGSLLGGSWTPTWASVQGFASSLFVGGETELPTSRNASQTRQPTRQTSHRDLGKPPGSWGPEPPTETRPRLEHVAAGSLAKRDAALKTMRTASVLESHEGVNGGLDTAGNFKKRNSDDNMRSSSQNDDDAAGHLVYIHQVQPDDTYYGIVLKYRCREDAFRRANGLWSRDNIQVRKWLALPVDACEVKGRPCSGPSSSGQIDLLAETPEVQDPLGQQDTHGVHDNYFAGSENGHSSEQPRPGDDDRPWTHVRWVSIDSYPNPVEIARMSRKAMGYFPPRRKKSIHTISALSTPRASVDAPSNILGSEPAVDSPRSASSRRLSFLSGHPQLAASLSNSGRSRVNSVEGEDGRPAWMRRPGGVGSLGRTVRAPGPERDYFNSWTNKHLPGLNIDSLPSMSVMGSEIARFGFGGAGDNAAIVESPFEDGRNATSASRQGGTSLDKAAAAVETWLRGAFAKRSPGTPILGPRARTAPDEGDLIELTDTNSDDGRPNLTPTDSGGLLSSFAPSSSSSRSVGAGAGTVRGRSLGAAAAAKTSKSD